MTTQFFDKDMDDNFKNIDLDTFNARLSIYHKSHQLMAIEEHGEDTDGEGSSRNSKREKTKINWDEENEEDKDSYHYSSDENIEE